jgi:hypothetical protein
MHDFSFQAGRAGRKVYCCLNFDEPSAENCYEKNLARESGIRAHTVLRHDEAQSSGGEVARQNDADILLGFDEEGRAGTKSECVRGDYAPLALSSQVLRR